MPQITNYRIKLLLQLLSMNNISRIFLNASLMNCLNQQSHVPKFGNWDGDNIPYTAYFENARIEKVGGMRINPNDPEENPEAFNLGQFGDGNTSIPVRISPDKPVTTKKFHRVQQKGSSHKCIGSESGSDRNMTDNTFAQPHHQSGRSGRNNSSTESQISPSQKQSYVDDFVST